MRSDLPRYTAFPQVTALNHPDGYFPYKEGVGGSSPSAPTAIALLRAGIRRSGQPTTSRPSRGYPAARAHPASRSSATTRSWPAIAASRVE